MLPIYRILDSLLDITRDLSSMAIALGPAPVVYQSTSQMINISSIERDGDNIGIVSGGVNDSSNVDDGRHVTIACDPVKYFEACLDNGHCDLIESEASNQDNTNVDNDDTWDDFNRDIEWM